MGEARFEIVLTERAWRDLEATDAYWTSVGEAWRGQKYFADLQAASVRELSDSATARRGRLTRDCDVAGVREILVFGVYRILYQIDEAIGRVEILGFFHAHRGTPPLS